MYSTSPKGHSLNVDHEMRHAHTHTHTHTHTYETRQGKNS